MWRNPAFKAATTIVHLTSSWASEVLGIERLGKMSTLDATDAVREHLVPHLASSAFDSFDTDARELLCKMAMQLAKLEGDGDESKALLPGELLKLFFAVLADESKRTSFMERETKTAEGTTGKHGFDAGSHAASQAALPPSSYADAWPKNHPEDQEDAVTSPASPDHEQDPRIPVLH